MREPNEAHRRRKEAVPIPGTPQIVRFRSLGSRSERDPLTPPSSPVWKAQLRAAGVPSADLPTAGFLKGTPTYVGGTYLLVGKYMPLPRNHQG